MSNETKMAFHDLIRTRRLELGLSQVEVSKRVGMSQEWYSRVERGGNKGSLKTHLLVRLADALELPYDALAVAAGIVRTKLAALALLHQAQLSDRDRDRLDEMHGWFDPLALQMTPRQANVLRQIAELLIEGVDAADNDTRAAPSG
jgi:transcriptional regulator with XRE-family HTH domain